MANYNKNYNTPYGFSQGGVDDERRKRQQAEQQRRIAIQQDPQRTQMVAQLLQEGAKKRPSKVYSHAQGLAGLGSELVDAWAGKRQIDRKLEKQAEVKADRSNIMSTYQRLSSAGKHKEANAGLASSGYEDFQKMAYEAEAQGYWDDVSTEDATALGYDKESVVQKHSKSNEYKVRQKRPTGPLVDMGAKTKSYGRIKLEENAADRVTEITENSNRGMRGLRMVGMLRRNIDSMEQEGMETGVFAEVRDSVMNAAIQMGFGEDFKAGLAASEDFQAISNRLQFMETEILKGQISDAEQLIAGKVNTRVTKSGLGNRFAIKRLEAASHVDIMHDVIIGDILDQHPDMPMDRIVRMAKRQMTSMPYVSEVAVDDNQLPEFFPTFHSKAKAKNPKWTTAQIKAAWERREDKLRAK